MTDFNSNKNATQVYMTSPISDDDEFGRNYKEVFPKELELRLEYQGIHASFLQLDIN